MTYLLIPAGLLVIYTQLFTTHVGWQQAVLRTVGALVPMVPEGLVLMTSIAFAVGVVRLGRRQCLVQELPAIEGLARVSVVCADKTGTLTENRMQVAGLHPLDPAIAMDTVIDVLASMAAEDVRPNASMQAVAEAYCNPPGWTVTATAPFKSATKWSGASFAGHGNWVLGAPDVLQDPSSAAAAQAEAAGSQGLRVLLLGSIDLAVDSPEAPAHLTPAALIMLRQAVRPDAAETLTYFAGQHVAVKVISGDNAASVGAVASTLGLDGDTLDARTLPADADELGEIVEKYTTFGRVRPDQKRAMIRALQRRGHIVAMTGDGVNDVLALKDADIGVAMGSGSSASRAVAQIVLLDNRFATLPYVVGEGRRVIGNIERVSNLFLTKTVYSVLLALLIGITGLAAKSWGIRSLMFPFEPIHVTVAGWFTIGIPAFILSLAPNTERAQPHFVRRVMTAAVPNGVVAGVGTFLCYLLAFRGHAETAAQQTQASTSALITLLVIAVWVLAVVARPYTWWRVILVALSGGAYVAIFSIPLACERFMLDPSNVAMTAHRLGGRCVRCGDRRSLMVVARIGRRGEARGCGAGQRADAGWRSSGKRGFRLRLRAESKPAAGDRNRFDANVMLLQRRDPWQQLCPLSPGQLFSGAKCTGHALDDDAPAFGHGVIVGLEENVIVDCCADQLGALRGAEEHRAVLDDEIDREDLGLTVDACDESPDRDAGK